MVKERCRRETVAESSGEPVEALEEAIRAQPGREVEESAPNAGKPESENGSEIDGLALRHPFLERESDLVHEEHEDSVTDQLRVVLAEIGETRGKSRIGEEGAAAPIKVESVPPPANPFGDGGGSEPLTQRFDERIEEAERAGRAETVDTAEGAHGEPGVLDGRIDLLDPGSFLEEAEGLGEEGGEESREEEAGAVGGEDGRTPDLPGEIESASERCRVRFRTGHDLDQWKGSDRKGQMVSEDARGYEGRALDGVHGNQRGRHGDDAVLARMLLDFLESGANGFDAVTDRECDEVEGAESAKPRRGRDHGWRRGGGGTAPARSSLAR